MYKFYKLFKKASAYPANESIFPVRLQDLRKTYPRGASATQALRGIHLQIEQGDFIAIMGPSGCGKTTLLNLIGLIDTPTSGHIYFAQKTMDSERQRQLYRRYHIGIVFQHFNLVDELNVIENIRLPLRYHTSRQTHMQPDHLQEWLQRLRLWHKRHAYPHELSGGQQQKVALLRALAMRPQLLLADEPTGNLDTRESAQVMQLIERLHSQEKLTVVMVTHAEQWARYARRIIYMLDGKIIAEERN